MHRVRKNRNTEYPSTIRDIAGELSSRLAAELAPLSRHFRAPLPEGVSVAARVALLDTRGLDLRELRAEPDAFVVVGRHSEASVRAADAASLSLRHALLIPQPAASNARLLLDVVLLAPTVRLEPWPKPLPPPIIERCSGYLLGDSLMLISPPHIAQISTAFTATDLPPGDDGARLVLEVWSGDRRVRLPLREPWLARGILLGRNPEKCSHPALADVLSSDHVSRCHLYLRREGDDVVFYDTASTFGVCVNDELIHRVAIPATANAVNPQSVVLSLTDDVFVTLHAS